MVLVQYYNSHRDDLGKKEVDYANDSYKIMLVTGYTFVATHDFRDDVVGTEISGTGYTAGGEALGSLTWGSVGVAVWDFADPTWSTATFSAQGAIIYEVVGSAATDRLICYIDFEGTKTVAARDFILEVSASGFHQIVVV